MRRACSPFVHDSGDGQEDGVDMTVTTQSIACNYESN